MSDDDLERTEKTLDRWYSIVTKDTRPLKSRKIDTGVKVELWEGKCQVAFCVDEDTHVHCPLCGEIVYNEGEPDTLTGLYECGNSHRFTVEPKVGE